MGVNLFQYKTNCYNCCMTLLVIWSIILALVRTAISFRLNFHQLRKCYNFWKTFNNILKTNTTLLRKT